MNGPIVVMSLTGRITVTRLLPSPLGMPPLAEKMLNENVPVAAAFRSTWMSTSVRSPQADGQHLSQALTSLDGV